MQFLLPQERDAVRRHELHWETCTRCELHKRRHKVVLWRGYIPCELFIVGEAPGANEDNEGIPFIGPAGQILDELMHEAARAVNYLPTYCISNTVGCIPYEGVKTREPAKEELASCSPRLVDLVSIAKPKVLLKCGSVAKSISFNLPTFTMSHPASMLHQKHLYGQLYSQCLTQMLLAFEECKR